MEGEGEGERERAGGREEGRKRDIVMYIADKIFYKSSIFHNFLAVIILKIKLHELKFSTTCTIYVSQRTFLLIQYHECSTSCERITNEPVTKITELYNR